MTTIADMITGSMLVGASDFNAGTPLVVDWLRLSSYTNTGTFQSRVLDAGGISDWTTLAATTVLPSGTSAGFETRTGDDVDTSDASWSPWTPLSGGAVASPDARYLQYRVTLATADPDRTPVVERVELTAVSVPVNEAPTAIDDTVTAAEDTNLVLPATGSGSPADNDTDPNEDGLFVTAVDLPVGGTVTLEAGSITFTPTGNLCGAGTGSFGYIVSDGDLTDGGLVTVDITCNNDAPVAVDGSATTDEDTNSEIMLVASDVDGPALTYAIVDVPTKGTLSGTAPALTYAPGINQTGPDSFTFRVNDGASDSNTATFSITITPANDGPTAVDDTVVATEDDRLVLLTSGVDSPAANDTDPENDSLTVTAVGAATGGSVALDAGEITFDPAANTCGVGIASFSYTVSDGALTDDGVVTLDIACLNDAPTVTNPGDQTDAEGASVNLQLVAADVDGDALTYSANGLPAGLSISPATGLISGTIGFAADGSHPVTVTVTDGIVATPVSTDFDWVVSGTNGPPVFDQDLGDRTDAEGETINLPAPATDPDGDVLVFAATGLPDGLAISPTTGTISGEIGTNAADSSPFDVTITVSDGLADDVADTFSWTIDGRNETPAAVDDTFDATEDTALILPADGTGSPAENDTDDDGDTLAVTDVADAMGGSVTLAIGSITFTPTGNLCGLGAGSFAYTISDGTLSDDGVVTLDIGCVNDEPIFDGDLAAREDTEGDIISLDASATDVDTNNLTYAASGLPDGLSIDPATGRISGTIAYTAAAQSPYDATITVRDGATVDATDTFTWTVADSAGPSVTLSSTASDPTNQAVIAVTVVFAASVTGFTATDVTTTNGSVSNFGGSGTTYTFDVAPVADGPVTVAVAADVAQDALGRGNVAATTLSRVVDRAGPSITLATPANGATTGDSTPTMSGNAGTAAGDNPAVTVRIYAGSTVGATPLQTRNATAGGASGAYAVDATTLPLGTYTAVARQVDLAGNIGNSAATTFTVADLTPPASPAGLTLTSSSTGLALDWPNNTEPDLAGYDVYRSVSADGPWTKLNGPLLTSSAYLDSAAPTSSTSFYQVRAVDTHTNSSAPATGTGNRPAIAFVSASTRQNGGSTSLAIPKPAGTATGDVLLAAMSLTGNPAITAPGGWTVVQNNVSVSYRQVVYAHVVGAGEGSSYTWSFSTSTFVAGGISAYRGVDPSQPIETAAGHANTSSRSIQAPTVTTVSPYALLVGMFGILTNPAITPPSGMIEQFEIATNGKNKATIESADRFIAPRRPPADVRDDRQARRQRGSEHRAAADQRPPAAPAPGRR